MLDTLLDPCFTKYSGSGFIPLSSKLAVLFPEFMHLYLFHGLKNVAKKETKRKL